MKNPKITTREEKAFVIKVVIDNKIKYFTTKTSGCGEESLTPYIKYADLISIKGWAQNKCRDIFGVGLRRRTRACNDKYVKLHKNKKVSVIEVNYKTFYVEPEYLIEEI